MEHTKMEEKTACSEAGSFLPVKAPSWLWGIGPPEIRDHFLEKAGVGRGVACVENIKKRQIPSVR